MLRVLQHSCIYVPADLLTSSCLSQSNTDTISDLFMFNGILHCKYIFYIFCKTAILIKQASIDILSQCQFVSLSVSVKPPFPYGNLSGFANSSNSVSVSSGIGLLPSPGAIENT